MLIVGVEKEFAIYIYNVERNWLWDNWGVNYEWRDKM